MERKMKGLYEAPRMERTQIETEGTFAGSIVEKDKVEVKATSQDYHEFEGDAFGGKNDAGITWE